MATAPPGFRPVAEVPQGFRRVAGPSEPPPGFTPVADQNDRTYKGLTDLAGYETPEDRLARWTPEDTHRFNTYAPAAVGLAASLAMPPMAPWLAGLTGAGVSAATRAATPLLEGEGIDRALEEANPANHPIATALDVGLPFVGKAVSNALAARSVADLPDYAKAVSANADLPAVPELPLPRPEAAADVSREALELSAPQTARAATTDAARYLLSRPNQASQIAGETLAGRGEMLRQIRNQAGHEIEQAFHGLSADDAEAVGAVLRGELADDAATPAVRATAARMDRLLSDLGSRAEGSGLMTRAETGEQYPFQKLQERFFPHVDREASPTVEVSRLLGRGGGVDRMAHQRTGEFDPMFHMTNAKDAIAAYVDDMAGKIANARYFGNSTPEAMIGDRAAPLWHQMVADGDKVGAEVYRERLLDLFDPSRIDRSAPARLADKVAKTTSQVALGQAAATSLPQIAASPMRFGFGNTIEGMMRYATDPATRDLIKASGAMDAGVTRMAQEAGVPAKTLAAKSMASMEHFLRGAGSAGSVPYAEQLIAKAQKASPSAATLRQLDELRIPLEEARAGLTADMLRRIVQRTADANQLQAHAMEHAPALLQNSYGRAFGQFSQYPIAQGRMASDAVVRPILSGLNEAAHLRDPSEALLGLGRAARWAPAVAGAAAVGEGIKSLSSGRDFELDNVKARALSTAGGLAGDLITAVEQGRTPLSVVAKAPPAISLLLQANDSRERMFDERNPEPLRGSTELLIDLLAAVDKTGTASVLRPTVRGYLRAQAQP